MLKTAMILSSGQGGVTHPTATFLPQALTPLGGQPALLRLLQQLADAGVEEVVLTLREMGDKLEQAIDMAQMAGYFPELNIFYSYEPEPLGTGGSVKKALDMLNGRPFFVVDAEAVWNEQETPLLKGLAENFDSVEMDALLATVPTESTRRFHPLGDFITHTGGQLELAWNKNQAPQVYAGVMVTTRQLWESIPSRAFPLEVAWQNAADKKRLFGHMYHGHWAEIDTPKGLALAQAIAAHQGEKGTMNA